MKYPMQFHITHLYPRHMDLYGDMGNIQAMRWTLGQMGIEAVYQSVEPGEDLPQRTHWYFIGGGQDKQQLEISSDLISKGQRIKDDIDRGVGLLAICGGFQLLGRNFVTGEGVVIPGVGLFPISTRALDASIHSRSIGDVVLSCMLPGLEGVSIVGFENHSGQTYCKNSLESKRESGYLGKVLVGNGNNAEEKIEGYYLKNAIGTYLHGSCLPKNPELTEFFIGAGLEVAGYAKELRNLVYPDQAIALKAKEERLRILV